MLCDRCNINQASVHLENNINGTVRKADLCPQCAALMGIGSEGSLFEQFFGGGALGGSLAQNFFGINAQSSAKQGLTEACPSCGTTFNEFQKTALFGCPSCYSNFEPRLASIFKRVQAGQNHVGRKLGVAAANEAQVKELSDVKEQKLEESPVTEDVQAAETVSPEEQIERLLQEQKAAVAKEDYEAAARLRDQIKVLKEAETEQKEDEA